MSQVDLEESFIEFESDLAIESEASSDSKHHAFFRLYAELAAENGDCIDLLYTPARREGKGGYQVDGVAVDVERGVLYVAVCDFRQDGVLETLNKDRIDSIMLRVRNFLELAVQPSFISELEEISPAFEAAYTIFSHTAAIKRIRVILFSNARLATRRPPEAAEEIIGKSVVYNFLDFSRYSYIQQSRGAPEPIEVDIVNLNGSMLPCLPAYSGTKEYQSYLIAIPGELLSRIYGLYGARLLEQNVRTFLQAKTKVNKGIITTIKDNPEMFFAYNNGLTATASSVKTSKDSSGFMGIESITDLQIVNGGQTTASILYAKDQNRADLSNVYVQMKLSVVKPELVETIVPKISRYANTQNKVSDADFFSSHPFHITIEKISRRLSAPPKPGAIAGSKWFYERARGQYKDGSAYGSVADKKKFALEYPKSQLIDKTDLAKYDLTFDCLPHRVCLGAQKCFMDFAGTTDKIWKESPLAFNEAWFKAAAAKALIFRWTDHMIGTAEWYKADRGYKSQTVAYTIGWLIHHIRKSGKIGLNLQAIWNQQALPEELCEALEAIARQVAKEIRNAPSAVKNIGEYCKQQACWAVISQADFEMNPLPNSILMDKEEARSAAKDAKAVQKIDLDIGLDNLMVGMASNAKQVIEIARKKGVLSPKSNAALEKISRKAFTLPPTERSALKNLLERLAEADVDLSQYTEA